jgi:hypothetical protein
MTKKMFIFDVLKRLILVFVVSLTVSVTFQLIIQIYNFGYRLGFSEGKKEAVLYYEESLGDYFRGIDVAEDIAKTQKEVVTEQIVVTPTPKDNSRLQTVEWGGPDLWVAVNLKRQSYGVNPLDQSDELCTIASIRLNELLELGSLDGHEGFTNLPEQREDIKQIFNNYSTVAEFLAVGGDSVEETVSLWDNTLAHKKLLTGGEYVWGCIYAQSSFAVAIAAF